MGWGEVGFTGAHTTFVVVGWVGGFTVQLEMDGIGVHTTWGGGGGGVGFTVQLEMDGIGAHGHATCQGDVGRGEWFTVQEGRV